MSIAQLIIYVTCTKKIAMIRVTVDHFPIIADV
jgi:hypothetical protein